MKKFCELKWKAFKIEELFKIKSGHDIYQKERTEGETPYVSATATQNGIGYFVGNSNETLEEGCLSVNRNGSVGYAFYHPYKALFGNDTRKLVPYCKNKYVCLFMAKSITLQKGKYGYGLKMGTGRLKKQSILLPANSDGSPDYAYMEAFMRSVEKELLDKYSQYIANREMGGVDDVKDEFKYLKWSAFELTSLFKIKSTSSSIDKKNLNGINGEIPYVTRSGSDNGIASFVSNQENYDTDHGNVITIGLDTQTVNYQPTSFYTGQNIQVLSSKYINRYTALFIIPLIKNQMKKFNWGGNGATLGRLKKLQLLLPAKSDGTPDYGFMEKYMKRQESKLLGLYAANKLKEYQSEEDSRML